MSVIDTPLIFLSIPDEKWSSFAGEKWAKHPLFGPLLRQSGAIFINRGQVDRRALDGAMAKLHEGYVFGLAVEGTRSKTFQMQRAKDGAAYLALKANVPLLPMGMIDTEKWHPNYKKFRPTHITSAIGPSFTLPELGRRVRTKDLPAYTHLIMIHIALQLPERYHGYYADSPALVALKAGHDPWPHCLAAEGVQP
jgi:1-acyl-sn-glycerol-3-phosphate acyltransferase